MNGKLTVLKVKKYRKDYLNRLRKMNLPTNQFIQNTCNEERSQCAKGINIVEIKTADYSSLAGTWKNAQGDTIVFDKTVL